MERNNESASTRTTYRSSNDVQTFLEISKPDSVSVQSTIKLLERIETMKLRGADAIGNVITRALAQTFRSALNSVMALNCWTKTSPEELFNSGSRQILLSEIKHFAQFVMAKKGEIRMRYDPSSGVLGGDQASYSVVTVPKLDAAFYDNFPFPALCPFLRKVVDSVSLEMILNDSYEKWWELEKAIIEMMRDA